MTMMVVVALALGACGHRPDAMVPVAFDPPPEKRVDMLVATTRAPSDDPAVRYSGERGESLRLDNVVVSIPPVHGREVGAIELPPERGKPDPQKSFVVTRVQTVDGPGAQAWFKRTGNRSRRVLVFVHGFNNNYTEAVFRFAQIAHDIRVDAAPVLFTWPSRANALDYVYDRESTIYSRFGLVEGLEKITASPDVADVTILAHSMGSWLTMEALRELAIRHGRVSPKIHNVVLASPDIDIDVFRRQVLELGDKHPHITIYSSRKDKALKISTFIAGDVERLGGADLRPYETIMAEHGISFIDATDAKQLDPLGHNAFAESSEMLQSLTARLSEQNLETAPAIGRTLIGRATLAPVRAISAIANAPP
ncbi:alpha/beta hydrolase [Rhizobium sp. CSW-27]|uniref:alpha/beta hydrolase n=1 Tax=Rhizobium sp. CSW-27 TaxID=2839985 RepID=UPI001C021772|nr:alpha/beta hydrolase [Rhizobium sp. CSW-27]MBT9372308.1 alpha/beta hydrolase [Rhizobium sp. CSW-27]